MDGQVALSWRDRFIEGAAGVIRLVPRGKNTLHRAIWRLAGAPPRFIGRVDRQWFCVDASDTDIAVTIFLYREWEPPASAVWVALLRPGAVVVDLGANKGWFSLLAASRVLPGGRVISYEPLERNHRDVATTAAANGSRHWTVRPVAAGRAAGSSPIFSPPDASGSGWGTMAAVTKPGYVSQSIETVRLDEDLAALGVDGVDLIKIDIEGYELEALHGASRLLNQGRIDNLLVEVHCRALGPEGVAELFALLVAAGYQARLLDEDAASTAEWRRRFRAEDRSTPSLLVPVTGADDAALQGRKWYKLLWSREAAA